MARVPTKYYDAREYLALERSREFKSEFFRGEMFAMAGASESQNPVALNIAAELRNALKDGDCRVYPSDMRVKLPTGLYTYPDVTVVCDEPRFEDEHRDTLLNPLIIFEVLSPTTEAYDRGKKFEHYRSISSLREYVLVAQDHVLVEHHARQSALGQWLLTAVPSLDAAVELPSLRCRLSLREIYAKVTLESPAPADALKSSPS